MKSLSLTFNYLYQSHREGHFTIKQPSMMAKTFHQSRWTSRRPERDVSAFRSRDRSNIFPKWACECRIWFALQCELCSMGQWTCGEGQKQSLSILNQTHRTFWKLWLSILGQVCCTSLPRTQPRWLLSYVCSLVSAVWKSCWNQIERQPALDFGFSEEVWAKFKDMQYPYKPASRRRYKNITVSHHWLNTCSTFWVGVHCLPFIGWAWVYSHQLEVHCLVFQNLILTDLEFLNHQLSMFMQAHF